MSPPRNPHERSTRRDLERYAGLFSARTRVMTSSATRDLMAMSDRPEVISFAGGLPDTSTFPSETFAAMTARIADESCAKALQYGPTDGLIETKRCIADVMAAEDMLVDTDDVLVTTGGQQVLDLVTKTLIDPGDTIVAEGPSYPGALNAFQAYQANVVQVDMDSDGMRVDLLEETLDQLDRDGKRPKFIYTVPSFQNPGGVTLSLPRRKRLVEVARERELLVLEDNPYGLLRYEGDPAPTLYSLDGGVYVMYLGTFSKIFSPGLRLGWVVAPPPVLARINLGKQQADLCTSTLSQILVQAYFERHDWREYIDTLSELYRARRDTMLDALAEHFPAQAEWTRPGGGLFIWATLPDFIDTSDLLARALRENVAFVPGEGAFLDGRGRSSMRLNFSGANEERIREGIRRIGEVVKEQVALYGTLTGEAPQPDAPRRPADAGSESEATADESEGGRVVELPRRADRQRRARGS
ncbi:MAG TPA: PLP-dependent aminotransferase family protein [Thermoleophilaceae bacterium]|nr:PLP-dependent aminotransferase family protein [Thermoleophilaceae bacterium]